MLEGFLSVIHVLVALFMIFVVLIQGGNQGGVGAALGGGSNSGSAFGASGATSLLGKLTYGAAFIFMVTTLTLTVIKGEAGKRGIADELSKDATQSTQPSLAPAEEPKSEEKAADPAPGADTQPQGDVQQGTDALQPSEATPETTAPEAAPPVVDQPADGDTD